MYTEQERILFEYCTHKVDPLECVKTLFGNVYHGMVKQLGSKFSHIMKNVVCSDLNMHNLQGLEKSKWVAARFLLSNSGCRFAHGINAFDLHHTTAGVYDRLTGVRMSPNPGLLDLNDNTKYAINGVHDFQDVISPMIFTSDENKPSELFNSLCAGGKMGATSTFCTMPGLHGIQGAWDWQLCFSRNDLG